RAVAWAGLVVMVTVAVPSSSMRAVASRAAAALARAARVAWSSAAVSLAISRSRAWWYSRCPHGRVVTVPSGVRRSTATWSGSVPNMTWARWAVAATSRPAAPAARQARRTRGHDTTEEPRAPRTGPVIVAGAVAAATRSRAWPMPHPVAADSSCAVVDRDRVAHRSRA